METHCDIHFEDGFDERRFSGAALLWNVEPKSILTDTCLSAACAHLSYNENSESTENIYMSYEVQYCRRTHLKCLGSTCRTAELSGLRVMAGRLGDALECSYYCQ